MVIESQHGFTIRSQQAYVQSRNLAFVRELFRGTAIEMDCRGLKGTPMQRLYDHNRPFRSLETFLGTGTGGFAGALDSRNLRLERARSDFDRRHVVIALAGYGPLFGNRARWGGNRNRTADAILGGWQASGTPTMCSGSPLTLESTGLDANLGGSARRGGFHRLLPQSERLSAFRRRLLRPQHPRPTSRWPRISASARATTCNCASIR